MRRYFITPEGDFHKANLHCHSTMSDGRMTPEELKGRYMGMGYSVIAFTDHELLFGHKELNSKDFLALHGYEMAVNQGDARSWVTCKTAHLNLLARDPDNLSQVCFHPPKNNWWRPAEQIAAVKFVPDDREPEYSADYLNHLIKAANDNGFIVAYNHPTWSLADYDDYKDLKGLWAVEVNNAGCGCAEAMEDSAVVYDHLLRRDPRVKALAADDNHNNLPQDDPRHHCGLGWVMIKAKALEYGEVFSALERGDFYASSGPEIYDLYYEDGKIHIECSPAVRIWVNCSGRSYGAAFPGKVGETITCADIKVGEGMTDYLRVTVVDSSGRKAFSNAMPIDWEWPKTGE